jgi:hypothetical protein
VHLYSVWDGVLVHTDLLCMFMLYYVSRSSVGTSCFALYFQVLLLRVASATRSLENNLIITLSLSCPYSGSLLVHVHRFFNTSDDEIYVDTTSNLTLSQDVSHTSRENRDWNYEMLEGIRVARDKVDRSCTYILILLATSHSTKMFPTLLTRTEIRIMRC